MAINWHKLLNYLYLGRERLAELVFSLFIFTFARLYLLLIMVLNIANWLLAYYVNKNVSQGLVVLHYNVNLGVNLVGNASDIYIIPTLGLCFIIINFFLLLNIFCKNKFFIHMLFSFTILTNLFLIAGTYAIYLINFR